MPSVSLPDATVLLLPADRRWAAREFLTAVVPGTLSATLVLYLFRPNALWSALAWLGSASVLVGALALISGAAVGWAIGLLSREMAYAMLNAAPSGERVTPVVMIEHIESRLDRANAEKFWNAFPSLRHLLHRQATGKSHRLPGHQTADPATDAFHYAKQWIELKHPSLSLSSHETTINLTAAAVLPSVLATISAARSLSGVNALMVIAFASLAVIAMIALLRRNFLNWRRWERLDALSVMAWAWEQMENDQEVVKLETDQEKVKGGLQGTAATTDNRRKWWHLTRDEVDTERRGRLPGP